MTDLILVIFSAALVNNIIVLGIIGADPALSNLRREQTAVNLSLIFIILLPLVTVTTWLMDTWVIRTLNLFSFQLFITVLVILCCVYSLQILFTVIKPVLAIRLNTLLPAAGLNVTVLGTVLINRELENGFLTSFAFALGTALGFGLILIVLTAAWERLEVADVPGPFKGAPVLLLTLAIMAMAFMGFNGLAGI